MKKDKSRKAQFNWGIITFDNPYQVIKAIFSFAGIAFYRDFIRDILLYSTSKKQYREKHAGNIIFLLEGIDCLLKACFAIHKVQQHSLLEIRAEDILNSNFYSLPKTGSRTWTDFPVALTEAEMLDPYTAFKKVFRHKGPGQWYETIKYLNEMACGSYEGTIKENILEAYLQLTRLFEAAHLIYVRELAHVRRWRYDAMHKMQSEP